MCLVCAGLLLVVFGRHFLSRDDSPPPITAQFSENGTLMREIRLFQKDEAYYAFFPAYASLERVVLQCDAGGEIAVGEHSASFGEPIDLTEFVDAGETISLLPGGSGVSYPLRIERSENLAALSITTESGSTNFIHASKSNKENARIVCILPDGSIDSEGTATIKCHGNSTFAVEKKSYKIKFQKRTALLGMEPAKKWIVQGNPFDNSKLRNRIAYYLAQRLGLPFAVETEYADLYINGEYAGNYMVQDSIDVARNRVDIPEQGSFLIVCGGSNSEEPEPVFTDSHGAQFTVKFPETLDETGTAAIRDYIDQIEDRIDKLGWDDSLEELGGAIDLDSLAVMFLVDALTNELDTNGASTYYYYSSADGLLHAGPAWDFDVSLGNSAVFDRDYSINVYISGLPEQLWKNAEFRALVREKLDACPALQQETFDYADASLEQISRSVMLDELRWSKSPQEGRRYIADSAYETNYVKWYLAQRFTLVDNAVHDPEKYCSVHIGSGRSGRIVWVERGKTIPGDIWGELCEIYECDGFTMEGGTRIWPGFPILSDLTIYPSGDAELESEGETGMNALIYVIIFAPGLIALLISGEYRITRRRDLVKVFAEYGLFELTVLCATFAVIFLAKGGVTIGWTTNLGQYTYPLSYSNVTLRLAGLQLIGSVLIGLCARLYFRVIRPILFPN